MAGMANRQRRPSLSIESSKVAAASVKSAVLAGAVQHRRERAVSSASF
jgi:hypothetical protein